MKNFIQNNWITGLGLGFIFTGILYFIKLAIDQDWLSVELRVGAATCLGISRL